MKDNFSEIARRTRRWKFEDGTTELMLGGIFFWASMYFLLQLIPGLSPVLIFVILVAGFIATILVTDILKRRYVYPRSGYVRYQEDAPRGIWKTLTLAAFVGLLVAALLCLALIYDNEHALAWITTFLPIFIGLIWLIANFYYKISRLGFLGSLSVVFGIVISPLVLGSQTTSGDFIVGVLLGLYFLVMAVSLLLSGGLTFRVYLRRTPPPIEAPDEQ
jgi:hypothetical protein